MNWLLCLCIGLGAVVARAETPADTYSLRPKGSKVIPWGHNFSSTSYLQPKGECTVGAQAIGCGVTDDFDVATSPWLINSYNMANLFTRIRIAQEGASNTTLQLAYFKTYRENRAQTTAYDPSGNPTLVEGVLDYQMEAAWFHWIRSLKANDHFVQHWNMNLQYYWDDRRPYSLRRPSMKDHRANLNLSDLFEVHLDGAYYLMAEFGILDVISANPHLLLGASWQWRIQNWMAHLGISINGTSEALFAPDRFDAQRRLHDTLRSYDDRYSEDYKKKDYGIHPEFSLQYYF